MGGGDSGRRWRVGEVATATGLTVRALRHYDDIGLLAPSERSAAGHRRYTADDLGRLYTIRALRHLGLPLAEIARVLIDDPDPREIVRGQLELLEQSITAAQRLRRGLHGLLATLEAATQPSVYTLTELIKGMISMESRLTPEQLRELTDGRRRMAEQLTDAQFAAMTHQRQTTMAQLPADELAAMTRRRSALTGPMDEHPESSTSIESWDTS